MIHMKSKKKEVKERETYNVVKDCKVKNDEGTLEALKVLLLKSLHFIFWLQNENLCLYYKYTW